MTKITSTLWSHKGVNIYRSASKHPPFEGHYYIEIPRRDMLGFTDTLPAAFRILKDAKSFIDDFEGGKTIDYLNDKRVVVWRRT